MRLRAEEAVGAVPNRTKVNRWLRRSSVDEPAKSGEVQYPLDGRAYRRRRRHEALCSYPGRPVASVSMYGKEGSAMGGSKRARSGKRRKQPRDNLKRGDLTIRSGSRRGGNDGATMGPQESDGRIVPQERRKAFPTASQMRGGKATTVDEKMMQLQLFHETAENPQGGTVSNPVGLPAGKARVRPKSRTTPRPPSSAMTMEKIADDTNLLMAFMEVAANHGAPGPDRQSIEQVREHLFELVPALQADLLKGTYRPGMIRRVWIPKPGGKKQRGLGIPNVVDRMVQQAVHRVLSPHFEPRFHDASHGFRPNRSCHTAIEAASVGFCVQQSRDGEAIVRLSRRSRQRINRKVVELTRRNWGNSLDAAIERINQYLRGWMGFFHVVGKAELYGLARIDAHIRRRLRALVFRQKKRRAHIVSWLHRKRRIPLKHAKMDVYGDRRSLWALSITRSAHKAMSTHWFEKQGLLRLERLWRKHNSSPVIASAQVPLELG